MYIMTYPIFRHAHVDAEYRPQDAAFFPKALPKSENSNHPHLLLWTSRAIPHEGLYKTGV